ncbi:MAG: hypothetical protein IKC16_06165 [Clostridia bacterium]|nr:hypothetical protein [Clostridia bacterium]
MKKIVSILLIISMLFAFTLAFCACGGTNTDTGTSTNTITESDKDTEGEALAPSDPNKITKSEWDEILSTTSYTAFDSEDSSTIYSTVGAVKIVEGDGDETYYVEKDGTVYRVSNGIGLKVNLGLTLGEMVFSSQLDNKYDDMVYNENEKCYTLSITDGDILSNGEYKLWFENGKLTKAFRERGYTSGTIEFSEIGTTIIESVPEFEIISF